MKSDINSHIEGSILRLNNFIADSKAKVNAWLKVKILESCEAFILEKGFSFKDKSDLESFVKERLTVVRVDYRPKYSDFAPDLGCFRVYLDWGKLKQCTLFEFGVGISVGGGNTLIDNSLKTNAIFIINPTEYEPSKT